ncbi:MULTISPECIES: HIT family protein [Butyrivibrio]|uniref:HIT family protein n=1 Tax=Butyrivibrio TaxID=830 RepID=UPI00041ED736|nr:MULTISPECIES: HIT family protein [Butyrivibrio]SFU55400.1 histidine triad (HIT) family protein [Butyrivibrio sp. M55]
MSDCIFCKIANGEIPSNTIYENEDFRVILDNGPATKGHALVLPKKHYADLFEIPDDVLAKAVQTGKVVASMLKEKLHCDGVNLVQNNGAAAGQTVMHYHLHVIPRYENDGQHILWKPTSPSAEELVEVKNTIIG